jgi:hypothetical protein
MHRERYPTVQDDFGHWLAGLIAGEGHFGIAPQRDTGTWKFRLHLGLRDDDRPTLEYIQRLTGLGRLYDKKTQGNTNPYTSWQVFAKPELAHLITLLERFPIRAKKARDYYIWRDACRYWMAQCRQGVRGDYAPIERAWEILKGIRAYDDNGVSLTFPDEESTLLALW